MNDYDEFEFGFFCGIALTVVVAFAAYGMAVLWS